MAVGIVMGVWIVAVGMYTFYYAYMMKNTGTVKTGWIVSKQIQLKESQNMPAFIELAVKKSIIFGIVATAGGLLFLLGVLSQFFIPMFISIIAIIIAYVWYSATLRSAEKKYLTPGKRKK